RGLLGALELVADKKTAGRFGPSLRLAERMFDCGYRNGVIFRAFSDHIIGLAPPLICTEDEIDMIFSRVRQTLDELFSEPDIRRACA
ncbi:MAG: aminotransferase class III-fold pyridoxal phosphate-dependent enzyme, partial [Alphaproteobacteria bacterium]